MSGKRKMGRVVKKIKRSSSDHGGKLGSSKWEIDHGLWLERNDHPLMNDVILDTLFKCVRPNDLKACRLVCKKWYLRTLPLARSTFHAIITGDHPHMDLTNHGIKDFIKLFGSNSLGFPLTKFKLGSFDPTIGLGKKCIQLFGGTAKTIDLCGTEEIHLVENISALLKSVPKLEYFKMPNSLFTKQATYNYWKSDLNNSSEFIGVKLFGESEVLSLKCLKTLEVGRELAEWRTRACPTFYKELLIAAENISTILTSHSFRQYDTGLELLKIFEKLGRESKLQILSLPQLNAEHLDVLRRMVLKTNGLKLKHLSVNYGGLLPPDLWVQLLDLLKHSLLSLQVHQNFVVLNHFPRMLELKLLDLKFFANAPKSLNLIDFSDSFPALQFLRLSSENSNLALGQKLNEFFKGSSDPFPVLESLNIKNFVVNIQTFRRTLYVFPKLKELEMSITVDGVNIIREIWTQMTRLEKLKIYGQLEAGNHIESLVTGISGDGIKKIEGNSLKRLNAMTMEMRRETISTLINHHRMLPSIGNLTNLRYLKLSLTEVDGRYKQHLGDLTGYLGFYSMKNLRHLKISDCEISKRCCEVLATDMDLESWTMRNSKKINIIPPRRNSENDKVWNFPSSKFSNNFKM